MPRRSKRLFAGALGGTGGVPVMVGDCDPVLISNVHYDADDPDMGPATIVAEVVPYDLGPFSYGVDREGPQRSVCYQVPGNQGPFLVDSLVGVGDFSSPIHSAPAPHAYPDNPTSICLSAHLHTFAGPAMPGRFLQTSTFAKISAQYGRLAWDPLGTYFSGFLGMTVPWTYVHVEHGFEPKTTTNVANAAGQTLKGVHFQVPVTTYVFRRTMIPEFDDYDSIAGGLVGKVNIGTWFGKAAETVLFLSYDMNEEERDPGGARVFTVTAQFKWRPVSWNYEPQNGKFRVWSQVVDAASQQPYDKVSFLPLLQYGLI